MRCGIRSLQYLAVMVLAWWDGRRYDIHQKMMDTRERSSSSSACKGAEKWVNGDQVLKTSRVLKKQDCPNGTNTSCRRVQLCGITCLQFGHIPCLMYFWRAQQQRLKGASRLEGCGQSRSLWGICAPYRTL